MKKQTLMNEIMKVKARSAWNKGVKEYALELVESIDENNLVYLSCDLQRVLLNGASDWIEYSWCGCSLIYNCDIAKRLCTRSEFLRKRGGLLRPNKYEEWLDVQARALNQAYYIVYACYSYLLGECEE